MGNVWFCIILSFAIRLIFFIASILSAPFAVFLIEKFKNPVMKVAIFAMDLALLYVLISIGYSSSPLPWEQAMLNTLTT